MMEPRRALEYYTYEYTATRQNRLNICVLADLNQPQLTLRDIYSFSG